MHINTIIKIANLFYIESSKLLKKTADTPILEVNRLLGQAFGDRWINVQQSEAKGAAYKAKYEQKEETFTWNTDPLTPTRIEYIPKEVSIGFYVGAVNDKIGVAAQATPPEQKDKFKFDVKAKPTYTFYLFRLEDVMDPETPSSDVQPELKKIDPKMIKDISTVKSDDPDEIAREFKIMEKRLNFENELGNKTTKKSESDIFKYEDANFIFVARRYGVKSLQNKHSFKIEGDVFSFPLPFSNTNKNRLDAMMWIEIELDNDLNMLGLGGPDFGYKLLKPQDYASDTDRDEISSFVANTADDIVERLESLIKEEQDKNSNLPYASTSITNLLFAIEGLTQAKMFSY